ncbi:hypothetical protein D8B35_03855 [Lactococcus laudensis]|nr:hypothetical protein [Lactococcus laudensis]
MQRKNKFKLVTFAMLLALLPSMNFEVISQAFNNGHVEQASLGKVFSPQETEAKTPSNQGVIKSNVPARSNLNRHCLFRKWFAFCWLALLSS